uniref:Uncharacterized protein n=1 Tax=Caenorhabditis japonica TaxID=281687 RepID=A0A8R1EV87_CAEJA
VDAVGRDFYSLMSRRFLGAAVDLDETYAWGIEELDRMRTEQEAIANEILPGATVQEAIAHLDQDASRKLHGTDALKAWMQETSDRAIEELGRSHFDIAEPIKALECMIAPTQTGGIYYTGPADDFSRPGRMWWSVPEGVTEFATWQEKTHGLPRGRARPSPAGRSSHLCLRHPQSLAAADVLGVRARRGLGAVCGEAHGRSRIHGRTGRLPRHARLAAAAGGQGGPRHRLPPRPRGSGQPRRWDLEPGEGLAVPHRQRRHGPFLPRLRTRPLPRVAGQAAVRPRRMYGTAGGFEVPFRAPLVVAELLLGQADDDAEDKGDERHDRRGDEEHRIVVMTGNDHTE